jgi:hypothetical protein
LFRLFVGNPDDEGSARKFARETRYPTTTPQFRPAAAAAASAAA